MSWSWAIWDSNRQLRLQSLGSPWLRLRRSGSGRQRHRQRGRPRAAPAGSNQLMVDGWYYNTTNLIPLITSCPDLRAESFTSWKMTTDGWDGWIRFYKDGWWWTDGSCDSWWTHGELWKFIDAWWMMVLWQFYGQQWLFDGLQGLADVKQSPNVGNELRNNSFRWILMNKGQYAPMRGHRPTKIYLARTTSTLTKQHVSSWHRYARHLCWSLNLMDIGGTSLNMYFFSKSFVYYMPESWLAVSDSQIVSALSPGTSCSWTMAKFLTWSSCLAKPWYYLHQYVLLSRTVWWGIKSNPEQTKSHCANSYHNKSGRITPLDTSHSVHDIIDQNSCATNPPSNIRNRPGILMHMNDTLRTSTYILQMYMHIHITNPFAVIPWITHPWHIPDVLDASSLRRFGEGEAAWRAPRRHQLRITDHKNDSLF